MVWRLAKEHGCVLVTRDEDFLRLSIVLGAPPKVIWLAVGNCSNQEVVGSARERVIKTFRSFVAMIRRPS